MNPGERLVAQGGVGASSGALRATSEPSHAGAGESSREPALPPSGFTYDWDADAALNALVELGDTPEAIAKRLLDLGLRGQPRTLCNCPISRYLSLRFGIVIGATPVRCFPRHGVHNGLPFPTAIVLFIRYFDAGEYPELEEAA